MVLKARSAWSRRSAIISLSWLKPQGSLWLNYGNCYATTPNGRSAADVMGDDRTFRDKPFATVGPIQRRDNGGEGHHHDRRAGI